MYTKNVNILSQLNWKLKPFQSIYADQMEDLH